MMSAQCELMEAETVQGKPLNAIAYGTLTGHLTRTLNALGLKREPIDVTPVLNEYLDTLQPAEPQDLVAVVAQINCYQNNSAPLSSPPHDLLQRQPIRQRTPARLAQPAERIPVHARGQHLSLSPQVPDIGRAHDV